MAKGEYAKAVESLQRVISQAENWSAKRWKCCKPAISSWVNCRMGRIPAARGGREHRCRCELMLADIIEARDGSEAAQVLLRVSFSVIRPCVCSISLWIPLK